MSGRSRYTPLKMRFAIDAEAHSTEYVTAVEMGHDSETLEFYAQVEPLKIKYLPIATSASSHSARVSARSGERQHPEAVRSLKLPPVE